MGSWRTGSRGIRVVGAWAAAIAAALYAPALGFGLVWDDPDWLRRAMDGPWWTAFGGTATYQFYRPLTVLYSRLWARGDGTVSAFGWHGAQVLWHAAAAWLVVMLAWRWTGRRRTAAWAGLFFAVAPLAHQPVSWAAAHQPLSVVLTLGSLLAWSSRPKVRVATGTGEDAGDRRDAVDVWDGGGGPRTGGHTGRRRVSPAEIVSVVAFAGALGTQESAVTVALLFPLVDTLCLGLRRPRAPVHACLGALFAVAWHVARRLDAYTGGGYDVRSLALFLQVPAWPVLGWLAPLAPDWIVADPPTRVAVLAVTGAAAVATVALASAWILRSGRHRLWILCAVWSAPILAMVWARLGWEYLRIGQRLAYPALPAVALAWSGAIDAAMTGRSIRRRRATGALVAATLAVAIGGVARLHGASSIGARFVATLAGAEGDEAARVIVNFPDRIALERGPLPLGEWGQIVAPVSLDLAQFGDWRRSPNGDPRRTARLGATGDVAAHEVSCAMPAAGDAARSATGLRWNLRGAPGDGAALVDCARAAAPADVFLSRLERRHAVLVHVGAIAERADAPSGSAAPGARAVRVCGAAEVVAGATIVEAPSLGVTVCAAPPILDHGDVLLRTRWTFDAPVEPSAGDDASPSALADVTPFVHVARAHGTVATADGDLWGGTVPLAALAGAVHAVVTDVRVVSAPPPSVDGASGDAAGTAPDTLSDEVAVRFGLYRRADGRRVPVVARRWDGAAWRPSPATDHAIALPAIRDR